MTSENDRPRRVLLFSSGNPDATFLAGGLLAGRADRVFIQGVEGDIPAAAVTRALGECGIDGQAWSSWVVSAPPAEPVDVGLTICVPT